MRKIQGDATKHDLREGSRGDDFSRGQKRARHFRNNAGRNLLLVGWDSPSRGTENSEALDRERGREKRDHVESEKEEGWQKGSRKDEGSETSKIEREKKHT